MHVLITGGAGFIGSNLAEFHLGRGDKVHVVDDLSTGSLQNVAPFLSHPAFRFDQADILTWDGLSPAIGWAVVSTHGGGSRGASGAGRDSGGQASLAEWNVLGVTCKVLA